MAVTAALLQLTLSLYVRNILADAASDAARHAALVGASALKPMRVYNSCATGLCVPTTRLNLRFLTCNAAQYRWYRCRSVPLYR